MVTAACFLDAGGPWGRQAPGLPCALSIFERDELIASLGHDMPREDEGMSERYWTNDGDDQRARSGANRRHVGKVVSGDGPCNRPVDNASLHMLIKHCRHAN
ncbi:hypothetical protein BRAS3843_3300001 [Bradyrhizobium sp. STM 3843]|nr:hypothetical protein BRAS3843_3300001 [Bradyrhizobium sp. STM 3843]